MAGFSFALVAALAVVVTATSLREKRQVYLGNNNNNQCSQGDGAYPHPSNCARFIQCHEGTTRDIECVKGLVFNPSSRVCDFPDNVPGCDDPNPMNIICKTGNIGDATSAQHPKWCNAFVQCGKGYRFPGCSFCGANMYFSQSTGKCETIGEFMDMNQECGNSPIIPPAEQTITLLDASCQPNGIDLFAALLAKINNGGIIYN